MKRAVRTAYEYRLWLAVAVVAIAVVDVAVVAVAVAFAVPFVAVVAASGVWMPTSSAVT